MSLPYVIAVILNTNRREDTLACLESLGQNTYYNQKIIVLDNHSIDGSVEAICSNFPAVQVIELNENRGYTGNNNVGIQAALEQGADWVFVLNEDTILAPDCLENLIQVGESDSQIGIVGPLVYHNDEPEVIQSAGGIFDRYWVALHIAKDEPDRGKFCEPYQVGWISGCGILLRRRLIEQIGMLDERFFIYWEETEWCLRASKNGWKIILVPQAKLWHKGVKRGFSPKPSFYYYTTRNRFLSLSKHHAPPIVWIVSIVQFFRIVTSWTVKPKWRSMRLNRDAMWHGLLDFLRHRSGPMPMQ